MKLAEQVARYLYKLMAYKDDHEIARLSLGPRVGEIVAAEFGPGSRVSFLLHPPLLRALACAPSSASDPGSGQRWTSGAR
jgi:indolepyruvate ferredoxin oxidoreductase